MTAGSGAFEDGDDGRLAEDDATALHVDTYVGGAEVDADHGATLPDPRLRRMTGDALRAPW